ncbi:succinate dehydrogenase cytochrome b subunit [Micromonospora sp. NPDC049559]|uniref:succinate dehydrogenase cytochrome b subunit n=1 Tax=Micromonospora sp. NPDC049559 TaxID=3155923 RepID=UPI00341C4011
MVATTTRAPIRSSVALKAVMAVTGILLVLFLIAHMLGNLKIFAGGGSFNHYAHWLREIGAPVLPGTWYLWIQRSVLGIALVAHIWAATVLALRARSARPVRYAHHRPVQGSYAARTMRWGGVIILLFVIYHLLDLTAGTLNPVGDRHDPYGNVVADFAPDHWYATLAYTLAIIALGFHLRHGVFSALRSLGQQTPRGERRARAAALAFAIALCAGYLVVPFAVLTGLIG